MKKKYILLPLIIIIGLFVTISLFSSLLYRFKVSRIENMLQKYFNLEIVDGLSDDCREEIEFYKMETPIEYNITKVVDYYLQQLKQANNDNRDEKVTKKQLYVNDNDYYIQYSKNYSGYVYDNNINLNSVKKELKEILIYKDSNWYIDVNSKEIVELPYGYYLSYSKLKYEKLDNVKKVINVKIIEKIDFDNNKYNKKGYKIKIKYLDKYNNIQVFNKSANYYFNTKLWGATLQRLYYNFTAKAEIRLCNHQYDREREEEEKRINEEMEEILRQQIEHEESLSIEERYFNPVFG